MFPGTASPSPQHKGPQHWRTVGPPPGKDALHLPARHSSRKGPAPCTAPRRPRNPQYTGTHTPTPCPRPTAQELRPRPSQSPAASLQVLLAPPVSDPWLWSDMDQSAASRHRNPVPSASQAEATSGQGHAELTGVGGTAMRLACRRSRPRTWEALARPPGYCSQVPRLWGGATNCSADARLL